MRSLTCVLQGSIPLALPSFALLLASLGTTACAGASATASGPPVPREYVWNDSEQRTCAKPPLRAEALEIVVPNGKPRRRTRGVRSIGGNGLSGDAGYLIPHIQKCMPWARKAARLPYGTVHTVFSIDCEGRVSAIRAITEDIEAMTVQCALTQI